MNEFLQGMRNGHRKGTMLPWSVVVAGYFAPWSGLVRAIIWLLREMSAWQDHAMAEAQRRYDQKIASRKRNV